MTWICKETSVYFGTNISKSITSRRDLSIYETTFGLFFTFKGISGFKCTLDRLTIVGYIVIIESTLILIMRINEAALILIPS